jgi:hypothetical protein
VCAPRPRAPERLIPLFSSLDRSTIVNGSIYRSYQRDLSFFFPSLPLPSVWVVHGSQLSWVSPPCTYLHAPLFGYVSPINLISLSERRTVDWCLCLSLTCWNLSSRFEMTHCLGAGPRAKTEDRHQPWKLGLTIESTSRFQGLIFLLLRLSFSLFYCTLHSLSTL